MFLFAIVYNKWINYNLLLCARIPNNVLCNKYIHTKWYYALTVIWRIIELFHLSWKSFLYTGSQKSSYTHTSLHAIYRLWKFIFEFSVKTAQNEIFVGACNYQMETALKIFEIWIHLPFIFIVIHSKFSQFILKNNQLKWQFWFFEKKIINYPFRYEVLHVDGGGYETRLMLVNHATMLFGITGLIHLWIWIWHVEITTTIASSVCHLSIGVLFES